MRILPAGICLLLAGVCLATDTPPLAAPPLCSDSGGAPACQSPKKDRKTARQAFARGLQLEKSQSEHSQNLDEAFYEYEEAARLAPQNVEYLTAREITRQHLAGMHLERGNSELLEGRQVEALAEFQMALNLDPQNEFAEQRIRDALPTVLARTASPPQVVASADALAAKPIDGFHDIHFRGDSQDLIAKVAASYGLKVIFEDNFPRRHVRFDIENVDFATAMQAAEAVTRSFSVALDDSVLFAASDTLENHKLYDRMGMRSFYIPAGDPSKDLNEMATALRTLFEFKLVNANAASSTITLRGPQAALDAATEFIDQLYSPRPEVMLDLKVFQVSHTYARNLGLHVPDNFNLYNISTAALGALAGQNLQSLLNNPNSQTIAALLAQLQSQANSIFSQPLATFGGGLTFMGLSLDQLSAVFSLNESSVQQLDHVHLRASQDKDATFKMGSRYPIINSSYSSGISSAALKALGVQSSSISMIPSVSYEDLGLTLKAKPLVHNNSDVALDLEVQFRTLGAMGANGDPIINNREYKGQILVKEGEQAAVAGMITTSEEKSLSGLPLFSKIPGLGHLTSQHSRQEEDDELLILITPYVVRGPERTDAPEIWMAK
ncbi:MAG: type II and III secretion system protein [Terriglobales bacterium]|jgi:tetratricopeptide (TPR) repeat protein